MSLYFQGRKPRQETVSSELERRWPSDDESINLGGAFQKHGPEDADMSEKMYAHIGNWDDEPLPEKKEIEDDESIETDRGDIRETDSS